MRKIFLVCALCSVLCASAYTTNDLSNAQYLANNAIIKKQKAPELYRLDDKILRQEVIGMALKLKGVSLPEDYICRKYFIDAIQNDWVCRAVELAADNGIISRENRRVRPMDQITRSEALAILLKTEKVSLSEPRRVIQHDGTVWSLFQDLKNLGFTQWQADMLDALPDCSLINHGVSCEDGASTHAVFAGFQPNVSALRREVFDFAALMMGYYAGDDVGMLLDDLGVLIQNSSHFKTQGAHNILSSKEIQELLYNEPTQANSSEPESVLVVFSDFECPFCARYFQDVVGPLLQDSTRKIALVYKQFPLSFHKNAYLWSIESECIKKNLGEADFFRYIHQRYLFPEASVYALAPTLSKSEMEACLEDTNLIQGIIDDQNLGVHYDVSGTPTTLIINLKTGYYDTVEGAYSKDSVEAVLDTVMGK